MKFTRCILPLAALTLAGACSDTTSIPALPTKLPVMNAQTAETLAKTEIIQLAHAYGIARDSYDGQAYASVFALDGKFHFQGEVFEGRAAIAGRVPPPESATGLSMHIVSTSQVELTSATTATGLHYGMVYVGDYPNGVKPDGPIAGNLASRGVYKDSYVLTDEGWKISERAYTPIFSGTPH